MPTPLYLGIDIGTSGCRALAIDDNGEVRGVGTAPLAEPIRRDGHITQDPELWWQACRAALEALLTTVSAGVIRAVAVDGTSGSVLLCDRQGRPVGAALMYNDSACRSQATRIDAHAPDDSGAHGASSGLAKLLYLLEKYGGAPVYVVNQADWIAGRLCGRFDISDENNCLKLGYDPVTRCWPAWLADLGVDPAVLPEVVAPGTPLGPVTDEQARAFGLQADTQVVAGTTDSIAAFLATGAREPGEAVTSLGSTLVLKIVATQPVFAPRYGVYSHRLGNLWLAGGASNSGGSVLKRFFTQQQLDGMTPLLRPECPTALDYYPLPGPGERFPVADPTLSPKLTPRPADDVVFFQGIIEGIARIEHLGYTRLAELGTPRLSSVRSAGGGAENTAWTRIRGELLGVPMLTAAHQAAAYGAALLARQPFHS